MQWTVVIPVKAPSTAKSRLGAGPEVAAAIALDTVEAASRAASVGEVVVVTTDASFPGLPGVRLVLEPEARGIAAAIAAGLTGIDGARAVLLGDLPALRPEDLDAALALAAREHRSYVADAEGTGTTLVTATAGVELLSAFGRGSAARHAALGLSKLPVDGSTVTRDVDDLSQLRAAERLGLGPRTARLISRAR